MQAAAAGKEALDRDADADADDDRWGDAGGLDESDAEEEEEERGDAGLAGAADLLHQFSSRTSATLGALGDGEGGGGRRGGRGRGRGSRGGRGRGGRRRRADEDVPYVLASERGAERGDRDRGEPSHSLDGDKPLAKRRRRGGAAAGGGGGLAGGAGSMLDGADSELFARVMRAHEQLVREFARQEAVKVLIADTGSAEHGIAQRAFGRIAALCGELGLEGDLVAMASQAAEILLMMRQVRCAWLWGTCGEPWGEGFVRAVPLAAAHMRVLLPHTHAAPTHPCYSHTPMLGPHTLNTLIMIHPCRRMSRPAISRTTP